MRSAAIILTALLLLSSSTRAEAQDLWSRLTEEQPPPRKEKKPKRSTAAPAKEPYCEFGVGPCGGTCNQEDGKSWSCLAKELPCYQRGRCSCEQAGACKSKKKSDLPSAAGRSRE